MSFFSRSIFFGKVFFPFFFCFRKVDDRIIKKCDTDLDFCLFHITHYFFIASLFFFFFERKGIH